MLSPGNLFCAHMRESIPEQHCFCGWVDGCVCVRSFIYLFMRNPPFRVALSTHPQRSPRRHFPVKFSGRPDWLMVPCLNYYLWLLKTLTVEFGKIHCHRGQCKWIQSTAHFFYTNDDPHLFHFHGLDGWWWWFCCWLFWLVANPLARVRYIPNPKWLIFPEQLIIV